jgi:sarcosine oxidase gamma subunit
MVMGETGRKVEMEPSSEGSRAEVEREKDEARQVATNLFQTLKNIDRSYGKEKKEAQRALHETRTKVNEVGPDEVFRVIKQERKELFMRLADEARRKQDEAEAGVGEFVTRLKDRDSEAVIDEREAMIRKSMATGNSSLLGVALKAFEVDNYWAQAEGVVKTAQAEQSLED